MTLRDNEVVELTTPTGPMRTHLFRPQAEGRYPGIVLYSEIFQVTGPIRRTAALLAGHGYVVAVPEIWHEFEAPGCVLAYDQAELNNIAETALRMARNSDGGAWWPELASSIDVGANMATAALPDSLGWFTLFDDALISDVAQVSDDNDFFLVPTVAGEMVTVRGATRIGSIAVFDARGRLVHSTMTAVVDVSTLASGVYAVLVNGTHHLRFVKP